jgi:O-acetyl-ADP-ribose deacetylase (regulator of RNase III)
LIQVVVDDLAFLEVDAVLRPANHTLDPASSVSTRLDQLAGQTFSTIRQVASPLEIGSAVVTTGGELAAPYVVHVVISTDQVNTDRSAVQRALASAWHRATEWQLARVATPLVGSGAGQLSLEDAAELMRDSLQLRPQADYPTEVQLVLEREADKDIVDEIMRRNS